MENQGCFHREPDDCMAKPKYIIRGWTNDRIQSAACEEHLGEQVRVVCDRGNSPAVVQPYGWSPKRGRKRYDDLKAGAEEAYNGELRALAERWGGP